MIVRKSAIAKDRMSALTNIDGEYLNSEGKKMLFLILHYCISFSKHSDP